MILLLKIILIKLKMGIWENIIKIAKSLGRNPKKLYHFLYESYFYKEKINWDKLLEELQRAKADFYLRRETIIKILSLQRPTKERLPYYEKIWKKHNYKNIIDIGCGLNPLSAFLVNKKFDSYLALDISPEILDFVKEASKILGKQIETKEYNFLELPSFEGEIALLWKVIPIMYKFRGHGYVMAYLNELKNRFNYISISFPRRTLGRGKPIGRAWKGYIRKISEKLNLKITDEFEIPTEYFIILSTQ